MKILTVEEIKKWVSEHAKWWANEDIRDNCVGNRSEEYVIEHLTMTSEWDGVENSIKSQLEDNEDFSDLDCETYFLDEYEKFTQSCTDEA